MQIRAKKTYYLNEPDESQRWSHHHWWTGPSIAVCPCPSVHSRLPMRSPVRFDSAMRECPSDIPRLLRMLRKQQLTKPRYVITEQCLYHCQGK